MKLLALDGNSIVNRAFYGIKVLTTKNGEFTNGIVGFLNILEKLKEETNPDAVAIAFDLKAPTFRHKAYAGYKAQRKGMPPEHAAHFFILHRRDESLYGLILLARREYRNFRKTIRCAFYCPGKFLHFRVRNSECLIEQHNNLILLPVIEVAGVVICKSQCIYDFL